ncbi:hypothetical protein G3R41_08895 [Modestobacter muralis]|uniref:Uncharacterized protein n=1 Tax=Modestobacter muralis TaxID=1608614 RepID=A0A6P0H8D5_9ACTN|nr:hypothetical protein [Modestobacter muralis]NEN51056.1 hypothetical protein [Modestobacter muralis]
MALLLAPTALDRAHASFSTTTSNSGDAWASDQLQPPSGLTATQSCTTTSAITQRASSTATGTASVTLPMPTGTTAGDYLLAHVGYHDSVQTLTVPTGWQLVGRTDNTTVSSNVYWKVATTGEPSAVFRHPDSSSPELFAGGVTAFRNVRPVAPVFGGVSGSSTTATTPSVTTSDTTVQLVHLFTKTQGPLYDVAGITDFYGTSTGTGDGVHVGIRGAGEAFAGPGSTPSRSATADSSSRWVAQAVVLERVAGTPTANLSWTPSPSTWASGYDLDRVSGGSTQSSTLTGVGTASTTQGPLVNGTAYTFRLTTARNAWRSTTVAVPFTPSC